jgi:hypothetical protein
MSQTLLLPLGEIAPPDWKTLTDFPATSMLADRDTAP